MPACEPYVPGYIYGTGESQNWFDGVPQPASFQGMSPWWTVPTNWYIRWIDCQIFVSPTWDFTQWVFAAKIDQDGMMKFQFPYGIRQNGIPSVPMNQFVVTYPPSVINAQAIYFKGNVPAVLPAVPTLPAIGYNAACCIFGWNTVSQIWFPISTEEGQSATVPPNAPLDAGSDQILFSESLTYPNDKTKSALLYNTAASVYGWDTVNQLWLPLITPDGIPVTPTTTGTYQGGQIAFTLDQAPVTPASPDNAQLYYEPTGRVYGWNTSNSSQIAIIS